uniref:Uncharacterized protein n=1 Tax=Rhizophora mucronata TaxID=61149 RepID=A0A2P2NWJ6_RHIMU
MLDLAGHQTAKHCQTHLKTQINVCPICPFFG